MFDYAKGDIVLFTSDEDLRKDYSSYGMVICNNAHEDGAQGTYDLITPTDFPGGQLVIERAYAGDMAPVSARIANELRPKLPQFFEAYNNPLKMLRPEPLALPNPPVFELGELVHVYEGEAYASCYQVIKSRVVDGKPKYTVLSSRETPGGQVIMEGVSPPDMMVVPMRKQRGVQDQFPEFMSTDKARTPELPEDADLEIVRQRRASKRVRYDSPA